jgi:hypothetical protein
MTFSLNTTGFSETFMNRKMTLEVITALIIILVTSTIVATPVLLQQQRVQAAMTRAGGEVLASDSKAPIVTSGDRNVYVVWWTNKSGNNEVMFRASNDGGATFAKKINLSNTAGAESVNAEIAASGKNVYVTWWERNQTGANTPVMKISIDNGKSFGPMLKLASNDTIISSK